MSDSAAPILYSADLKHCALLPFLSTDHVTSVFTWIMEEAGATVVRGASHNFSGMGLTSVLILTESHAVLHTWPESGTVHLDIFSCSTRLKSHNAIAALGEVFAASSVSVHEVARADGHLRAATQVA